MKLNLKYKFPHSIKFLAKILIIQSLSIILSSNSDIFTIY